MPNILFLHYGPGGNAQIERELLGSYFAPAEVEFWDQPILPSSECTFERLSQSVLAKAKTLTPPFKIWGHSFGADLALKLLSQLPQAIDRVFLFNPVFDLKKAFYSLAQALANRDTTSADHRQRLQDLLNQTTAEDFDSRLFWPLIGAIVQTPFFSNLFWANEELCRRYTDVAARTSGLDQAMWQAILSEQIDDQRKAPRPALSPSEQKKITLVSGRCDPYRVAGVTQSEWTRLYPHIRSIELEQIGHYAHLEMPVTQLKSILISD